MAARRGSRTGDPRAAMWATLTIAAFPIVALSATWLGLHPLVSFVLGGIASLLVLLTEGVFRRRWWISEPHFADILEDPALGHRMLVVLGIILLIFETFILAGFLTNRTFDQNILRFVLQRQCTYPDNAFYARLCTAYVEPPAYTGVNTAEAAIRQEAAKRYFPDVGLVTCSLIRLGQDVQPMGITHSDLVRCDRWVVGRIAGQPVPVQTVQATVMAQLHIQEDGSYAVSSWTDDPSSKEWSHIGRGIAEPSLERQQQLMINENVSDILASENFRRIMEFLSAK